MDKKRLLIGLGLPAVLTAATVMLTGGKLTAQLTNQPLLSCEHHAYLFPSAPESAADRRSTAERWRDRYDFTVSGIVDAHLASPASSVVCSGGAGMTASDRLLELARVLPPWSQGAPVTEADMPAVLLAYAGAYECALNNRASRLFTHVKDDAIAWPGQTGIFTEGTNPDLVLPSLVKAVQREQAVITKELSMAPLTLHRLLRYLAGIDRLRPVEASLRCLERASLDIRNILALNADIAACSYARKGQGSLKNLAQ